MVNQTLDNKVLLGSSDEEEMNDELLETLPQKHIAIWDIELNQISTPVKVNAEFGNLSRLMISMLGIYLSSLKS